MIDITYQQLQRYENGSSQIGTDRLQALAQSLEAPISYFFEEEKAVSAVGAEGAAQYVTTEEERLLKYLKKIPRKEYKRSIFVFLRLAAERGEGSPGKRDI